MEIKTAPTKRKFQLWQEGFRMKGAENEATYLGEFEGNNFDDACLNWAKQSSSMAHYKNRPPRFWGCRIFDNEADARKNFG